MPKPSKIFETYINKVNVKMDSKTLSMNKLKDDFFSLKVNKSSGVAGINFNVMKKMLWVALQTLDLPISVIFLKGSIYR